MKKIVQTGPEDGGVHLEMAYTLSDVYIQRLEELSEVTQVEHLLQDALCAFTERVQQAKTSSLANNRQVSALYYPACLR